MKNFIKSKIWIIVNPPLDENKEIIFDFIKTASECSTPEKIYIYTKENDKNLAKQQANAIFDECVSRIENNKSKTTQDMIEHNIKINNCLVEAVKQEIQKGFNPQQQAQMLEYLEQTRNDVWNFYNEIYTANKYCYGQCGSMSSLLAYSDEGHILMQMLERLLYLNRAKNGY